MSPMARPSWFSRLAPALLMALLPSPIRSALELETVWEISQLGYYYVRLSVTPYLYINSKGLQWCAVECKRRGRCLSFNYIRSALQCQLIDMDSSSDQASLVNAGHTFFFDSSSWTEILQDILGDCNSKPCAINERCETVAGHVVCIRTECAVDPPSIDNAIVGSSPKDIGVTMSYSCNKGYVIQGAPTYTTCKSDGHWTAPNVNCRLDVRYAKNPGYPNNLEDSNTTITASLTHAGTKTVEYNFTMEACDNYEVVLDSTQGYTYAVPCAPGTSSSSFVMSVTSFKVYLTEQGAPAYVRFEIEYLGIF